MHRYLLHRAISFYSRWSSARQHRWCYLFLLARPRQNDTWNESCVEGTDRQERWDLADTYRANVPIQTATMAVCRKLEKVELMHWLVGYFRVRRRSAAEFDRTLATIITATIFLAAGITGLKNRNFPTDVHSLMSMGFGAVHPKSLVGFITPSVWTMISTLSTFR